MTALIRRAAALLCLAGLALATALPARAASPDRIEAFLQVTGFDVALDSIRNSASSAPQMIGLQAEAFGSEWSRLVDEVFDTALMHDMALDILGQTLEDGPLNHAVEFYASDLGQRLVAAENAALQVEDPEEKSLIGTEIIDGLVRIGSPRLSEIKRLNAASGSDDSSIRAIQEVQVRFLMAAAGAGVVELRMDEADLRAALKAQESEMRIAMQAEALAASAYTYQAFSDAEVAAYAEALEHPEMKSVYALLNAVQFEIMANRFEAVARRLQSLRPSQDL